MNLEDCMKEHSLDENHRKDSGKEQTSILGRDLVSLDVAKLYSIKYLW